MQKRIPVKLPVTNILSTATRTIAVTTIAGYQRFISPHKGFSCAHRVLYGCESCSQYFKRVIAEDGILVAIANVKGRFQECREANEILKARRTKCQSRRRYYANRLVANTMPIESGEPNDEQDSDISAEPQDSPNPDQPNIGGSRWASKRRSQAKGGESSNNCGNSNDCADFADCINGIDVMDCDRLKCPDLSCSDLNCGHADCLSGMDCSGCGDCGSLDCGGADCGSCG
ncbi:MAG: membrane protein insertion efficiency factor YidD [Pseudanabaena sp. M158S2SP1A06QC]|nr:membrane protein insertion efficiency factor YidD [Pseudanabaena sp. M158S2SP1A06QC]MCA6624505.1 membrane protein insertion efficiency factor YidD [Pseudanabaena sp. M165S2SP1A06QC]